MSTAHGSAAILSLPPPILRLDGSLLNGCSCP
uniref:Uncharacterized protein n=1 Tax=Arundo donax TaxID=35708 RepID=A0A0A8ZKS5_ARUDO